jgi:hypothetical protein
MTEENICRNCRKDTQQIGKYYGCQKSVNRNRNLPCDDFVSKKRGKK